jgi:predicted negative regulator of RcsB-dependent stress response
VSQITLKQYWQFTGKYLLLCTIICTFFIVNSGYELEQNKKTVQTQETLFEQWFPKANAARASLLHQSLAASNSS